MLTQFVCLHFADNNEEGIDDPEEVSNRPTDL